MSLNDLCIMSRFKKKVISICIDTVILLLCFHISLWLRLDEIVFISSFEGVSTILFLIVSSLFVFNKIGLYKAVLRYLGYQILVVIVSGAVVSSSLLALYSYYFSFSLPRSIPFIYCVSLILLLSGVRLLFRGLVIQTLGRRAPNVLIYGAGTSGRQLALALKNSSESNVVGFIDEDETLCGTNLLGLHVYHLSRVPNLISLKSVQTILLAIPNASRQKRRQVLEKLAPLSVDIRTVPDINDIAQGKATIQDIKEVAIEDLLGREPVAPQQSLLEKNIKNKVVMVTGAGGSIGSELCRQIIRNSPKSLLLFDVSEFNLYKIHQELLSEIQSQNLNIDLFPLLGSVQRKHRLLVIMQNFKVNTVYHAAAYKHVPLVENNVVEGVRNNVFGTLYTAQAAIESKVESFVLISTDKAVRPTNVMGTTKRLAELALQALSEPNDQYPNHITRFCMVRFGNVLGSSGSVIPLFKKQITQKLPITVTHPDITRYFMTIPEAAQLVIQAGAMGKGGDVFVLDMGEPVKIVDLATNLIHLSGLEIKNADNPNGDIEIIYTGLRPGEKLYEELLIGDENVESTAHGRIMTASEKFLPLHEYMTLIENLDVACHERDYEKIRSIMMSAPTDFEPVSGIEDLVWKTN